MASEAVVPDHTTDEQVKKVNEETRTAEQEGVSPLEENGETEGEKPKIEEEARFKAPLIESEEKVQDKQIESPVIMEAEKVDDASGSDVPVADDLQVGASPDSKPDISFVPEPDIEAVEKASEEPSKVHEISGLSIEAVKKPVENLEVSSIKEKPEVGKEPEGISVVDPKIVEKPETVAEMEGKLKEQSEIIKEVEEKSEMLECKESLISDMTKDEGTLADKVKEGFESLKEEQIIIYQELVVSECTDTVVSTDQGADADLKEDEGSIFPDAVEKVNVVNINKKGGVDVVDVLKEAIAEVVEFEENKEEKNVKIEERKEESVKIEGLTQPKPTETKDVGGSDSATEVTEKSFEEENASRIVEVTTEEKKEEAIRDDLPISDAEADVINFNIVNEPVMASKESELEAKAEETIESGVDKPDKMEEMVEKIASFDAPNLELSKNVDNIKTDGDPPKQEVPAKSTQKQSNNIISKVKQSIVKVKKAIIGKSPSSKTPSSEGKVDIQVK